MSGLNRVSVSLLAAILGVAQLAAASLPTENTQRARVARDAFYKCVVMTVSDYDDGVSPATVVAKAVAFKCRNWLDTWLRYVPPTEASVLAAEVKRGDEGDLLGIVLHNRVLKSTPQPPLATSGGTRITVPSGGRRR